MKVNTITGQKSCFSAKSLLFLNMKLLVVHGPNLALLGKVSAHSGSRLTLDKINRQLRRRANELGVELKIFQGFDEGQIVKIVRRYRNDVAGVLFALGALSRSCFVLRELLAILQIPVVEVHLSEMPYARESYTRSALREVVTDQIYDPGAEVYITGLNRLWEIASGIK